jgi:hypothetical protein
MRFIVGEAVRVQVIAPLAIQSEQAIPAGTLLGVFDCLKCERGRYGSRSGQCEPPLQDPVGGRMLEAGAHECADLRRPPESVVSCRAPTSRSLREP